MGSNSHLTGAELRALASLPPNQTILQNPRLPKAPLSAAQTRGVILPDSFDARLQWPGLAAADVLDQGACGSCFVFATTSVLQDRLSILAGEAFAQLSQQYVLLCFYNPLLSLGCNGGVPEAVLSWLSANDLPFNSNVPYVAGTKPASVTPPAEYCSNVLAKSNVPVVRGGSTYTVANDQGSDQVNEIKMELYHRGPVAAAMNVYQDFQVAWNARETGIYKYDGTSPLDGGHAVKIIGWGPGYWLVQNSWGLSGTIGSDLGFFKIALGVNEVGIEQQVSAIFAPFNTALLPRAGSDTHLHLPRANRLAVLYETIVAQYAIAIGAVSAIVVTLLFLLIVASAGSR